MNKVILKVGGMSCSACSNHVEKYLQKQKGVIEASVNLVMGQALVTYDETLTLNDLKKYIEETGYEYLGVYDEAKENEQQEKITPLIVLSILGILLMYISMAPMFNLPTLKFLNNHFNPLGYGLALALLTIPYLIYGIDILKKGLKNIFKRSPNMDSLVALGVIFAFLYSLYGLIMIMLGKVEYSHNLYFESSAIVILFIKLGRFIEAKATGKTKEALKELVQITPAKAYLKIGQDIKEVTIDEVKKDDILVCRPYEKIAVDGFIVKGKTHIDEAFITGESKPSKKIKGAQVLAGSLNMEGYIEYKTVKIGKDSLISEIVHLVMEATSTKAPVAKLADKVSSYFVPAIMGVSLLTFLIHLGLGSPFSFSLMKMVTVLVVACPCSLGLATPLAIVVSIGSCAKKGILIKNSAVFEKAQDINTIVFDKTGTLTQGSLKVAHIYNYNKDDYLINKVASLEKQSTHPLSKSFKEYPSNLEVKDFQELPGIGLTGIILNKQIYVGSNKLFKKLNLKNNYINDEKKLTAEECSIVYVIEDHKVIGLIGIKDVIKDEAIDVIKSLKNLNIETFMLTGDNQKTASLVGNYLGIKNIKAELLPQEKTKIIKDLIKNGKKVMMVGDGINDAPSLAVASLGVSFISATDIAALSSEVILMSNDLNRIISLIKISQKTLKIIKENLLFSFIYNILMIPLAMGLFTNISLNPMLASLAMMLSSLTVVLNSLRLKKYPTENK